MACSYVSLRNGRTESEVARLRRPDGVSPLARRAGLSGVGNVCRREMPSMTSSSELVVAVAVPGSAQGHADMGPSVRTLEGVRKAGPLSASSSDEYADE